MAVSISTSFFFNEDTSLSSAVSRSSCRVMAFSSCKNEQSTSFAPISEPWQAADTVMPDTRGAVFLLSAMGSVWTINLRKRNRIKDGLDTRLDCGDLRF